VVGPAATADTDELMDDDAVESVDAIEMDTMPAPPPKAVVRPRPSRPLAATINPEAAGSRPAAVVAAAALRFRKCPPVVPAPAPPEPRPRPQEPVAAAPLRRR
jgi:hypothetical protein